MLGSLAIPQLVSPAEAQEEPEFTCTVVDDVLSWTDQGVDRYQIRQLVGDSETFLTAVDDGTSLALSGNADEYAVRYRVGLVVTETRCAGNPAPEFTCSVADGVLTWTDQGADKYQIRQRNGDSETFLTSVSDGLSLVLPGTAEQYVVRVRNNGNITETSCAGNPAPEFTCSVAEGVLSWTDQGADNYNVRQISGDVSSYLGATDGLSFPVTGFADTYIVRARINGVVSDASCEGTPLPEFTCEVVLDDDNLFVLTWTDQEQDRYQIRQVVDGTEGFLIAVSEATEVIVDGNAEEYVVRYRDNGMIIETRCAPFI